MPDAVIHIHNPDVSPDEIYVDTGEVVVHIDEEAVPGLPRTYLVFTSFRNHMGRRERTPVTVATDECGCR